MSTILKALKRSEASRPRDSSLPLGQVPDPGRARRRTPGPWLLGAALALVALAVLAWWLLPGVGVSPSDSGGGLRQIAEVSLPARVSSPPGGEAESSGNEPAAGGDAAPPAVESSPDEGSHEARPEEPEAPARAGSGPRKSPSAGGGAADEAARPAPEADATAPPAAPEIRPLDRFALLPRLENLTAGRRDALPKLTLNAHVHAPEPAQRFVLINLSRYGEGDQVAPGLVVDTIFPGGVVLKDKQGRFVVPRP